LCIVGGTMEVDESSGDYGSKCVKVVNLD
jgi:hypothetical protein